MDITFGKLVYYRTKEKIKAGPKPIIDNIVNNTKQDLTLMASLLTGGYRKELQYQLVKYTNQLNMIEKTLNSSKTNYNQKLNMIR